jgi:hypothetical protein
MEAIQWGKSRIDKGKERGKERERLHGPVGTRVIQETRGHVCFQPPAVLNCFISFTLLKYNRFYFRISSLAPSRKIKFNMLPEGPSRKKTNVVEKKRKYKSELGSKCGQNLDCALKGIANCCLKHTTGKLNFQGAFTELQLSYRISV